MSRPPKRERVLVTRDGYLLVQDDPFDHAVPVVVVSKGGMAIRFVYENTVTIDDGSGRFTMTTYVEEASEDLENGDTKGHRPP
jgi:hypothetical protein